VDRPPHSHFYRGGRGRADSHNLTSIVRACGWADPIISLLSLWPRIGRSPCLIVSGWPPGERNRLLTFIGAVAGWAIKKVWLEGGGVCHLA